MLQQTQVKTATPYWKRWMRELPTVAALAAAPEQRVLKLWQGLGYYTRARNLRRAAQLVVARHGGIIPDRLDDLLALPGVGRYTAGAVASIAFNQPAAILDGNVTRVLARLFGITRSPREAAVNRRLWELAAAMVGAAAESKAPRACSRLNQALMELGALVCLPRQPKCDSCPLRQPCAARRKGLVGEIPAARLRPSAERRYHEVFVLENNGRFLMRQNPDAGVNRRLWQFPGYESQAAHRPTPADLLGRLGIVAARLEPLKTVRHQIMRYAIETRAHRAEFQRQEHSWAKPGRWVSLKELAALPLPSAHQKIAQMLTGGAQSETPSGASRLRRRRPGRAAPIPPPPSGSGSCPSPAPRRRVRGVPGG